MKILLAIDGTAHGQEAVGMVSAFDLESVEVIRILTVIDMALPFAHDIYSGVVTNTVEIENAAREAAGQTLETTKQSLLGMIGEGKTEVELKTVVGSPESRIVEEAEAMGSDIIIVGSHGYNSWERLLLGSVSDSVIHHAPCSVLIVRSRGRG